MHDKKWKAFFDLCNDIMNDVPRIGSWADAKAELVSRAEANGGETAFGEIVSWFGGQFDDPPQPPPANTSAKVA